MGEGGGENWKPAILPNKTEKSLKNFSQYLFPLGRG